MARLELGLVFLLICGSAQAAYAPDKAIEDVALKVASLLDKVALGDVKSVAVLPLWGDTDGYVGDMLKAALTRKGIEVLVRSDEEWKMLLDEIAWNVKREDIMDATTIQRFGKIKGCDAVMYGTVRLVTQNVGGMRGMARLSVHIADVETGRVVWSSGPVEGAGYMHWSEMVTAVIMDRFVWVVVVVVLAMAVLLMVVKRAATPR